MNFPFRPHSVFAFDTSVGRVFELVLLFLVLFEVRNHQLQAENGAKVLDVEGVKR